MMAWVSAGRRRVALGAAAAIVVVGAGCSSSSPRVAAYVGDAQISQQQVQSAVAAISTTVQPGQTVSTDAVVNAMIQGELAAQIAADRKIPLTDAARDTALKGSPLAPLLTVPGARPVAYDVADQQIVATKLGEKAFLAEIKKRSVKLNPRYGVLDLSQKTIVPEQSGSLSRPAATPEAP